jgi:hypothetical protein
MECALCDPPVTSLAGSAALSRLRGAITKSEVERTVVTVYYTLLVFNVVLIFTVL